MANELRMTRPRWVGYLRVSTHEQAERELSVPAQRTAIAAYASQHGATIDAEYVESGSGRDPHRPEFRRMIGDALAAGSDIGVIVVHHTSRFTRDATEARLVKRRLRKAGVRVLSVCQEIQDDPVGTLVEGIFECIDEYESEINGARTAAAMREAVRQGYFPSSIPPYGFTTRPVELHPGVTRHVLVHEPTEAAIVRELFGLYVSTSGSKAVARELNRRGRTRRGTTWTKDLVLRVVEDEAVAGTFWWGRHTTRDQRPRPRSEWLALHVEPIVDADTFALAKRIRVNREAARAVHGASSPPHVLHGFARCGSCGASLQLETSGKRVDGKQYQYAYYNCRRALRAGIESCAGHRLRTKVLDTAVLVRIAKVACTAERTSRLATRIGWTGTIADLAARWRALVTTEPAIGREYVRRTLARVVVNGEEVTLVPRDPDTPIAA